MKPAVYRLITAGLLLGLSGATASIIALADDPAASQWTPPSPVVPQGDRAVAALLERAARELEHHHLDAAAATLERALRLAPRNPELWQQLAEVRLLQGELQQAEAMAVKSNQLAKDTRVRVRNAELIAAARGTMNPRVTARSSAATSKTLQRLAAESERRRQAERQVAQLTEALAVEQAREAPMPAWRRMERQHPQPVYPHTPTQELSDAEADRADGSYGYSLSRFFR
jgi:tetratricopeptide (TPR) repeat protein